MYYKVKPPFAGSRYVLKEEPVDMTNGVRTSYTQHGCYQYREFDEPVTIPGEAPYPNQTILGKNILFFTYAGYRCCQSLDLVEIVR